MKIWEQYNNEDVEARNNQGQDRHKTRWLEIQPLNPAHSNCWSYLCIPDSARAWTNSVTRKTSFRICQEQLKEESTENLGSRFGVREASCLHIPAHLSFQPSSLLVPLKPAHHLRRLQIHLLQLQEVLGALISSFNCCFNWLFPLSGMQWFRRQLFLQDLCCIPPRVTQLLLCSANQAHPKLCLTPCSLLAGFECPHTAGQAALVYQTEADSNIRALPQQRFRTSRFLGHRIHSWDRES